jgi:hypothetical protein
MRKDLFWLEVHYQLIPLLWVAHHGRSIWQSKTIYFMANVQKEQEKEEEGLGSLYSLQRQTTTTQRTPTRAQLLRVSTTSQ